MIFERFKNVSLVKEICESEKFASIRQRFEKALNEHIDALALNAYMALLYEGEYISRLEDAMASLSL